MCDYSLTGVASRPAEVAETLVSTDFLRCSTRGFASVHDENVAVCLLPGTEIAFENDVRVQRAFFAKNIHAKMARFRKVNVGEPHQHHDALEFADGTVVLLNDLVPGQRATVLQLPADPREHGQRSDRTADDRPSEATASDAEVALT
jgi:hypothetical protein